MRYGSLPARKRYAAVAALIFVSYLVLHLVFGRHELPAYDAYTYISFAEHYMEHWFHTLVPGQVHGLQIVSYPPLVLQMLAVTALLPLLNTVSAYILLISLGATTAAFAFAHLFRTVTGFADLDLPLLALLVAFSPGLLKFVLVHGQLTLVFGLTFGFLAVALFQQVIHGAQRGALLAAALVLTAYAHHFSFLITLLLIALLAVLQVRRVVPRLDYLIPVFAAAAIVAGIGLLPMVRETLFGITQGRIFHGSRLPLARADVFHQFLTTTYGATILGIPLLFGTRVRTLLVSLPAVVFMAIGLGLTTPIPEALFGTMSTFLTFDRFSLVSSFFLTGVIAVYVLDPPARLRSLRSIDVPARELLLAAFILLGLATVFFANAVHLGSLTGYGKYDAAQTDRAVAYLEANASSDHLYLTLDHQPPAAEVQRRTGLPTLDTGYHPGREVDFLASTGLPRLDRISRENLSLILDNADAVSLKHVLTFSPRTADWMADSNWTNASLGSGVVAWTNPRPVPAYEPDLGERRVLFGLVPGIALLLAALLLVSVRARSRAEQVLDTAAAAVTAAVSRADSSGHLRVLVIVLPLLAVAPALLSPGIYPAGIDTPAHIFKLDLLAAMVAEHGTVFLWTDWWYSGYPFLAMYPPASIAAGFLGTLVLQDALLAHTLLRVAAVLLLAAAVHRLAEHLFDDRRVSLFAVALAVLSYPLYNNLFTVGRVASALALPIYIVLVHVLLRDDIFQRQVSRGHVLLGLGAALLFLTHAMMAYLFVITGILFLVVYRDRVRALGPLPVLVTALIPLFLGAPYLFRVVTHSAITDPSWYVVPQPFTLIGHVSRGFSNAVPHYIGGVHAAFLVAGIAASRRIPDRFFRFALLNTAAFYLLFWLRDFRLAWFLPMSGQFDLARFEVLFALFGVFVAAYGFRHVLTEKLPDASSAAKTLFLLVLLGVVVLETAPMLSQSANWSPAFADELDELDLDPDYRAMGAGMRQWDAYILRDIGMKNVFGWFRQGNPNFVFTRALQNTGGRWYGTGGTDPVNVRHPELRRTLLELSNTKYVLVAKGQWFPERVTPQVKGGEPTPAPKDAQLLAELSADPAFTEIHASAHLSVFELGRDMSFCEPVTPLWIEENYLQRAVGLLMSSRTFEAFPVRGAPPRTADEPPSPVPSATCTRPDPYTIRINATGSGWLLVKESSYPYWTRADGGDIHDGFGFMVVHVTGDTELVHRPPSLTSRILPG